MDFREFIKNHNVILDGATGTVLQDLGLKPNELPERWNVLKKDVLIALHKAYYDAGSNVVSANTFGANILRYGEEELDAVIKAAIENVKTARDLSEGGQEKFVAADIGPTGKLLEPYGDLKFEDAVEIFAKTVRLIKKYGVDLIFVQTMNDSYETKACVLAVKENCDLPVIVTNAYGENGKLMTGADPSAMSCMLEGLGVDAVGANCSYGPKELSGVIDELLACSSVPVVFMPNAGLPVNVNGKARYDVSKEEFADEVKKTVDKGVRIIGGCCGTTPEYISLLKERIKGARVKEILPKKLTRVSSYAKEVRIGDRPVVIGERINPTGKKRFRLALKERDFGYILNEGVSQADAGAHVLDVNVGTPETDEGALLPEVVAKLQAVADTPLQIDTSDAVALDNAMRIYNGKPLVNSVNGKESSMNAVFPLIRKYGGVVIALTLDENGIPNTADGRLAIAMKILGRAREFGIKRENIVFDPLCMTVATDPDSANITLDAVRLIKERTGCSVSLGVSNVSFGLPERENVNAAFLTLALGRGLDCAIVNPFSAPVMNAFYSFNALSGDETGLKEYVEKAANGDGATATTTEKETDLKTAIVKGLKERAGEITDGLLADCDPFDIINNEIIPALDEVGKRYEEKTVYLPQLLTSAEAAKRAFESIKKKAAGMPVKVKCDFIIATVYGDIHDIGKNIVKLLLENYGFNVIDLGKDVPPEVVVKEVVNRHAFLCGLSALMTTTVPAMKDTVALIKKRAPWCKVVVGGAVLNESCAREMGADKYAKDAMETVRFAEEVYAKLN